MKRIIGAFWLLLLMAVPAFATVNIETTRVAYTCNGVLTSYAYPFKVLADADLLVVKKATATSAETTLTLNTDYTVTGAGSSAGTVVLTAGSKCGTGYTLTILRNMAATQGTDYVDGEAFSAESIENALDKVTLIQQQQREEITRAPKLPKASTITDIALPNPSANGYIGWNSSATGLANLTGPVTTTATQYEIDALMSYGGGTSTTQATIEAALTAIGTTNKVTLLLRPGNWDILTALAFPENVTVKIAPGAYFSGAGADEITFAAGSVSEIDPNWWTPNVSPKTTDMTTAVQNAINAGIANNIPLTITSMMLLTAPVNIDRSPATGWPQKYYTIKSATGGGFYTKTATTMFSSTFVVTTAPLSHLILFDKITFENETATDATWVINEVLFRVTFNLCNFDKIKLIYSSIYTQSIYLFGGRVISFNGNFIEVAGLTFDLKMIGVAVESSTGNFMSVQYLSGCAIIGNLAENISGAFIKYKGMLGVEISGNYFEDNGLDLEYIVAGGIGDVQGVNFSGNQTRRSVALHDTYSVQWGRVAGITSHGNWSNGSLHYFGVGGTYDDHISIFDQADHLIDFALLKAPKNTLAGTTTTVSGAATTLFSSALAGMYIIHAYVAGAAPADYSAHAIATSTGDTTFKITATNGVHLTLTTNGVDVQATQDSGVNKDVVWSYYWIGKDLP